MRNHASTSSSVAVLARHTIFPALPGFIDAYPEIDLQISLSDHQVDLVRDGFDCELQAGSISEDAQK
jgi:DNA-binding transcriptional LysR family regulator